MGYSAACLPPSSQILLLGKVSLSWITSLHLHGVILVKVVLLSLIFVPRRNYIAFVLVLGPNLRLNAWQLHAPVQKLGKQA